MRRSHPGRWGWGRSSHKGGKEADDGGDGDDDDAESMFPSRRAPVPSRPGMEYPVQGNPSLRPLKKIKPYASAATTFSMWAS